MKLFSIEEFISFFLPEKASPSTVRLSIRKLNQKKTIPEYVLLPKKEETIYIYIYRLNPLKSELFTKQACRDAVVVYSLFFSPTTYTSLYSYVLSTVLRISNFTLYISIYICFGEYS